MAGLRHLAEPHPYFADFPASLPPGTEVTWMSRDRLPVTPEPGLSIEEFTVPARDGYAISVRTYRLVFNTDKLPVFVYIHGGGWVTGSLETDDATCRRLARELPLVVVNVEYRLAPEHKFPVGIEDCYDVVKWVASPKGQEKLNADLTKAFLLGGTSAGAQFTASLAPLYRDDPALSPPITGLVFLAGNLVDTRATPPEYPDAILSVDEIISAPGLTKEAVDYFAEMYDADPWDVRRSPLLFESWKGVAKKAVISVCGWDPRRDEGVLFEKLLKDAGVECRMEVWNGLPHGFWTVCRSLDVSEEWERKLVGDVRWLIE